MNRNGYKVTVGLEIHAELKTRTKMFCDSKNDPDEKGPNVNVCPICMGYPGTLPTINKEAVKHIIRLGITVGGEVANETQFDRKNYFYPDIPKGYQISQYKHPLIRGGSLNGVNITRIHLEEDTARSTHQDDHSLVDFNRAGIPLMELVTEPVIGSAKKAADFGRELQLLLQYLGAGEANMEKGEMRVEANVSVSKTKELGTKVEIKNLNSFRAVERAIDYEVSRHIETLENGERLEQETRGWHEEKEITFGQRSKEESHDYRYFPEPDLPKLVISEIPDFNPNTLKKDLPELPWQRRERLINLGIKSEDAEVFVRNNNWHAYFETVLLSIGRDGGNTQLAANYITSDLAGLVKTDQGTDFSTVILSEKIPPANFSKLIGLANEKKISSRGAKDILKIMYGRGGEPAGIAERENLLQKSDEGEMERVAHEVISQNPQAVAEYRSGKESSLQFLIGQGMKISRGSANPEVLKAVLKKTLDS